MGIKTDYLKDCITNKTITVQEIIDLKNQLGLIPSIDDINNNIDNLLSQLEQKLNIKIDDLKKELEEEFENEIQQLKALILLLQKKLDEIYNKVVAFQFKTIKEIERNKNNDIVKIYFTDNSLIEVEYINLPWENEYINYMPSRLNYYDENKNLIAIEKIDYKNESIFGFSNKNFEGQK